MVSRLVYQEAAAVALVTMPATEVIGAVLRVEHPFKVDARDLTNCPRSNQLGNLGVVRGVSVVEGDANLYAFRVSRNLYPHVPNPGLELAEAN